MFRRLSVLFYGLDPAIVMAVEEYALSEKEMQIDTVSDLEALKQSIEDKTYCAWVLAGEEEALSAMPFRGEYDVAIYIMQDPMKEAFHLTQDGICLFDKPIRLHTLFEQVRRECGTSGLSSDTYQLNEHYTLIPAERVLVCQLPAEDVSIDVSELEVSILSYLYQYQGEVISKQQLLSDVFGYASDTETRTLETHIYRLRSKLEPYGMPLLETSQNGYALIEKQ